VAIHARTVILISRPALELLSPAELRALVAHESGHEYVWEEHARATARREKRRLRDLELVCDVIAVMTLRAIGEAPTSLVTAIEKITLFNRVRLGHADNEDSYPAVAQRRSVALSLGSRVPRAR
jgi:ferric-dicitrate binding protein FerR (iron transport regulator)